MIRLITLLIVSTFVISTCCAYCPNDQDLSPCGCVVQFNRTIIFCETSQNQLNLTSIFSKVSKDPRAVQEIYLLYISNSKLIQIPENAFGKIKFDSIIIHEGCSSLETIHPNAFSNQLKITHQLLIEARNVIPEKSKPNYFYDLVNSFENLKQFKYSSQIGTLEEKFSKNLNSLTSLYLSVDAIQGSPFSNMSIKYVELSHGDLNYVSKNVFKNRNSDESLLIDLTHNNLNGSSFENGVFTETSLKKVEVTLRLGDNQIKYLDEAIFMPFLTKYGNNIDFISDEPLDCDDCRSAWICKSNKSKQIRNAIFKGSGEAKCVDGRDFTDCTKNFLKCK